MRCVRRTQRHSKQYIAITIIGSASFEHLRLYCADMAQEVEHVLGKDEVTSSNLVISSTKKGFPVESFFRGAGRAQLALLGNIHVEINRVARCVGSFAANATIGESGFLYLLFQSR